MKICHYIFGMPPLRGGGTIKYAMDLAAVQASLGHDVSLLYPGEINHSKKTIRIIQRKNFDQVKVWEIMNPLPVSLVTGIKETDVFMVPGDISVYRDYFTREKPEVLHVHSLMGAHRELFIAAKEIGVKLLFSTHDYFGICPKTNLLYKGQICQDVFWRNCGVCCQDAEDLSVLVRRQTHWFQWCIKHKKLVQFKRMIYDVVAKEKRKKSGAIVELQPMDNVNTSYEKLRQYYLEELKIMDLIIFNSSVTKKHYEKRIDVSKSIIKQEMHSGIRDHRRLRKYGSTICLAYLGYPVEYKGYSLLLEILDELNKKYPSSFSLTVYMDEQQEQRSYICRKDMFNYQQLPEVYAAMDVLIVPSLWAETYGFVVPEALSFGVPVVITENVGAGDLIRLHNDIGFIAKASFDGIKQVLESIIKDRTLLEKANRAICSSTLNFDYEKYVREILDIYLRKA